MKEENLLPDRLLLRNLFRKITLPCPPPSVPWDLGIVLDLTLDWASRPHGGPAHADRRPRRWVTSHPLGRYSPALDPCPGLCLRVSGGREGPEGRGRPGHSLCAPPEAGQGGWGRGGLRPPPTASQSSGLEARRADVRLVEGMGAVYHVGGRGRAGRQHRAQGLMAA